MRSKTLFLSVIFLIIGVFLLGFVLLSVFQPSESITGKVTTTIVQEFTEEGGEPSSQEQPEEICSGMQCNPYNAEQICVGGKWITCPGDKVCNLGECVQPVSVGPSNRNIISSGWAGGGGRGGGRIATATPSAEPETTSSLGIVEDISEIKVKENGRVTFTIDNTEQIFRVSSLSPTSATIQLGSQQRAFNLGDEQKIDMNTDGSDDYSLVLDSINSVSKEARFLVTKI